MNYREKLIEEGWVINQHQEDENGINVVASFATVSSTGTIAAHRTVQLKERKPGMDLNKFWERFYINCRQSMHP